jgi:DNA-binding NarL/FixJ family response regulator
LRVLIADDHAVVRQGLCAILESRGDWEVCGEATNGEEAVQKTLKLNPDLIVLDITMPVLDGFSAARKIRATLPDVPILMLSMHDGLNVIDAARAVGAQGFVTKTEIAGVLLEAVDCLLRGEPFFRTSNTR